MDVEQRLVLGAVLAQAHLLDDDGDRVRQLVAHALERGLADQLGDQDLLGGVGEVAVGVELRALGQQPDQQVGEQRRPGRRDCAETGTISAHSVPVSTPSCWMSSRCSPICSGVARSVLVAIATLMVRLTLRHLVDDEPVAGPDLLVGREADRDHVDLGQRRLHQVVEPLAEQRARPVQPGGVDEDQLGVGAVHDAAHDGAGGLRLVGGDHHLAADQGVGQRRLAGVGPADERHEAALVRGGARSVMCSLASSYSAQICSSVLPAALPAR